MQTKCFLVTMVWAAVALTGVACSGAAQAPATAVTSASNQSVPTTAVSLPQTPTQVGSNSSATFKTETVEGGSVSVAVTPRSLGEGAPLEFEIAMNTHSVDLSNDMLKSVVLRDDRGEEYKPTSWEGPAGGGHHRSGRIAFVALAAGARSVTLIVKNIAGVAERTFSWEFPQ